MNRYISYHNQVFCGETTNSDGETTRNYTAYGCDACHNYQERRVIVKDYSEHAV